MLINRDSSIGLRLVSSLADILLASRSYILRGDLSSAGDTVPDIGGLVIPRPDIIGRLSVSCSINS